MPNAKGKPVRRGNRGKGGRKPAPPQSKLGSRIPFNFTEEQKAIIKRAAALDHDKVGNWGRRIVLQAAYARLGITPPEAEQPAAGK